jgi:hypothetical protein
VVGQGHKFIQVLSGTGLQLHQIATAVVIFCGLNFEESTCGENHYTTKFVAVWIFRNARDDITHKFMLERFTADTHVYVERSYICTLP